MGIGSAQYGSAGMTALAARPPEVVERSAPGWVRQACYLLVKDIRSELRTRTDSAAIGVFAFGALLLVGLSTAALRDVQIVGARGVVRPAWDGQEKLALLWVLLCFAAFSGISRSFTQEEDRGTAVALRVTMSAEAVYTGKLLYNGALLLAITAVMTPAYMLITNMPAGNPALFGPIMIGGVVSLAAVTTITAALVARARAAPALFGALGLPLLLAFILLLENAARTLYTRDAGALLAVRDIGGLLAYGVLLIAASWLLFRFVWED